LFVVVVVKGKLWSWVAENSEQFAASWRSTNREVICVFVVIVVGFLLLLLLWNLQELAGKIPTSVCLYQLSPHPTVFFSHWGWLGLFFFSFGFGFGFVVAVFGFVEVGGARDTVSWFSFSKCAGGRKGKKIVLLSWFCILFYSTSVALCCCMRKSWYGHGFNRKSATGVRTKKRETHKIEGKHEKLSHSKF
jgi:hypothetical protein